MKIQRTPLAIFNSCMMFTKPDIIDSFDDYVAHHREHNNEEHYSEHKRKVLLSLCDQFRAELEKCNIPALTKPWFYYDYFVMNDCIELSLFKCQGDIRFDEDDHIVSMSSSVEYTLIKVHCEYLNVEQYANLYHVSPTTVRQWIRRGKLRTARKKGRDWLIPALADKPGRGFDPVTYIWETLSGDVITAFPFLDTINCIHLYQDNQDKKVFYAISFCSHRENIIRETLTIREREQLELLLISDPDVTIKDPGIPFNYVAAKNSTSLPVLSYQDDNLEELDYSFTDIFVKQYCQDITSFSPFDPPRTPICYDLSAAYLVPVQWVFWGVPDDDSSTLIESIILGDFSNCTRICTLYGNIILCKQMIIDGYDPLIVCESESDDLQDVMNALLTTGGPLNEISGDPFQDVFYIGELAMKESLQDRHLGSRILQELPRLSATLLHVTPDILVYYPDAKDEFRAEDEFRAFADFNTAAESPPTRNVTGKNHTSLDFSDNQNSAQTGKIIPFTRKFNPDSAGFRTNDTAKHDDGSNLSSPDQTGSANETDHKEENPLISFYRKNGFRELGQERILYTTIKMKQRYLKVNRKNDSEVSSFLSPEFPGIPVVGKYVVLIVDNHTLKILCGEVIVTHSV